MEESSAVVTVQSAAVAAGLVSCIVSVTSALMRTHPFHYYNGFYRRHFLLYTISATNHIGHKPYPPQSMTISATWYTLNTWLSWLWQLWSCFVAEMFVADMVVADMVVAEMVVADVVCGRWL